MIESTSICDELITYFELNKQKQRQGVTLGGVDLDSKSSLDIAISPKDLLLPENKCLENYFEALFQCYTDYCVQWPFLNGFANELHIGALIFSDMKKANIFKKLYRKSYISSLHRLFAFMTYLNDVADEDGGSTVFTHYGLIQPQKGHTLIWPAEWTHAHKEVYKKFKYIITGWMHFPEHDMNFPTPQAKRIVLEAELSLGDTVNSNI